MKCTARWMKVALAAVLVTVVAGFAARAQANDLPLAAASPLTGVAFDDRPLLLPVQRNFQMAMLTAGSELGRSCGKMEAYGWRMSQTEQARVNQIFNNTVDRMRMMGYTIAPQTLTSVSNDITLFTADSRDRHFIFLWSAGELGLVMTLCETTAPLASTYHPALAVPPVQVFPVPSDVVSSHLDAPTRFQTKAADDSFTPLGEWIGGYTCAQGYTGATLKLNHLTGKDFDGVFKFYPTEKNPAMPSGEYTVYGQYDKASARILINPGKWVQRPHNYYNTVIVGSFDPVRQTFSAYFQGVTGCTSFEARRMEQPVVKTTYKKGHKKPLVKKKPAPKKAASTGVTKVKASSLLPPPPPSPVTMEAPLAIAPPPPPVSAPPAAAPSTAPAVPAPAATPVSSAQPMPAVVPPVAVPPAAVPAPPPADDRKDPGGIVLSAPSAGK